MSVILVGSEQNIIGDQGTTGFNFDSGRGLRFDDGARLQGEYGLDCSTDRQIVVVR